VPVCLFRRQTERRCLPAAAVNPRNTARLLPALLVVVGIVSMHAAVPSEQRSALVDLFTTTGGASWRDNYHWNAADPCDNSWYGVSCNAPGTTVT
jgi:hypothetical protein